MHNYEKTMESCKRQKRITLDSTLGRKKETQGNERQGGIGQVDINQRERERERERAKAETITCKRRLGTTILHCWRREEGKRRVYA